jgi:hypothetical protein
LNGNNLKNAFENFRLTDLKDNSEVGRANLNKIQEHVKSNLDEVIKYFNSTDEKFGLSPHPVVLLGSKAQLIFKKLIKPELLQAMCCLDLMCIGMPHPTAMIGNDALEFAGIQIQKHLKPIQGDIKRWRYSKNNHDIWESI